MTTTTPAWFGSGLVGQCRNLRASLTTAGTSITFYWDEVYVKASLGALAHCITNTGGLTLSISTTGAGGLDTGTVAASTWYSVYAAYNPTTGASCLFACLSSTSGGSVYSGSNAPSGYTATALVGVHVTNTGSQFSVFQQRDRRVVFPTMNVLTTSTTQASLTALTISSAIPPNAIEVSGYAGHSAPGASSTAMIIQIASDATGCGTIDIELQVPSVGSCVMYTQFSVMVYTAQTIFYTLNIGQAGQTSVIQVSGFSF